MAFSPLAGKTTVVMRMPSEALLQKVKTAPKSPGCYLFRDRMGNIVYVGKAKCLSTRVRNYFQPSSAEDERLVDLLPVIQDVEYRTTDTELDALQLEYKLIKQYKPWFNLQLKPDKPRPYLRIDTNAHFPSFTFAAERADDGAEYFDCFVDEYDIKAALDLFNQVWRLPQCGKASFEKPSRSCLYRQLNNCMAPCTGQADAAAYGAATGAVLDMLRGGPVPKLAELEQQMVACAEALDFEKASVFKQQIEGIRRLQHKSRKMFHLPKDADVLVCIRPYREAAFSLFYAHHGEVYHRADFPSGPDDAALDAFIAQIHSGRPSIEDSGWLAGCLLEVLADKQFAVLTGGKSVHEALRDFPAWKT